MRHIDVGSSINGFVAHVASFREIECMDIRELKVRGHENIKFLRGDITSLDHVDLRRSDSVSCLHAIEHFGLGRYGDQIDPLGHLKGFRNLTRILESGGRLYISFPIGRENEVHFNAHRVFHPHDIFRWPGAESLVLERFDFVDDTGDIHLNVNILQHLPIVIQGCGIYSFRKQ